MTDIDAYFIPSMSAIISSRAKIIMKLVIGRKRNFKSSAYFPKQESLKKEFFQRRIGGTKAKTLK